MPKMSPPPPVTGETWRALLGVAATFQAAKPWEFMYDTDLVGMMAPVTGETRIASVLGNAGEVFAAVFYRRVGIRWIIQMASDDMDPECLSTVEGMDCLKVEFVPKKQLWKDDVARLKAADFRPAGRGAVWPQFRSAEPGWHAWHVTQAEAEQLLADLPRLIAFTKLVEEHPDLYESRAPAEIPFLPAKLPDRLMPGNLDWHPVVPAPSPRREPYQPPPEQMERLLALKRVPVVFEFDSSFMPGASFLQDGRPCFVRLSLLVETQRGLVLGAELHAGSTPAAEAAGRALVKALLSAASLPKKLKVFGTQLVPLSIHFAAR